MARRKRKPGARIVVGALALAALAVAGWVGYRHFDRSQPLIKVSAERVDPANEGRRVQVSGRLTASSAARDADMDIAAGAALLLRKVEMLQWREHCERAAPCTYETAWSSQRIESSGFREPQGHENPPMRLVDAHFAGADLKLGAFVVDPELVAAHVALVDHPVHAADLPPNLAAIFADASGALYAGGDASHPRVGEVKVSYRLAPLGEVVLRGVQHGNRLTAE
ncbi:MAG TPA: TMEM43 family protein [Rudaea sp.]|nr:TMEM43 family protein [Rudaea sp.]